jgi:hypothetical protein
LALGIVIAFAVAMLYADILRHPLYTPDGIVYARFAARAAGQSERDATLNARAFYDRTAMMRVPRYRQLIELDPSIAFARSQVFANRPLYPWLVALLLPAVGFKALFVISALAYVAFGAALFWALTAFGRPWFAAVFSLAILALPLTRDLAASDLTDMAGVLWWTVALGALLRCLSGEPRKMLWVLAIASVLLALTRPTPYLVVIPAIALSLLRRSWWPFAASLAGAAAFAAVAVSVHAFGAGEQLRWIYAHEPRRASGSFEQWYRAALFSTVKYIVAAAIRTIVPIVLLAATIYAWVRAHMRDEAIVLLAAALACLAAVPFNPVPAAISRVVLFPMLPVFAAMAQAAVSAFAPEVGSGSVRPYAAKS